MFCEMLCEICRNRLDMTEDGLHYTCKAYPDGIPEDAPCVNISNVDLYRKGATPPKECPGDFRFDEPEQHKEQWRNVLAAERGERDWDFPL